MKTRRTLRKQKILKQAINKDNKWSDIEMLNVSDRKVKEDHEIAELFNEHFVSTGERLAKEIGPVDISPTQQVKKQNQNLGLERSHR